MDLFASIQYLWIVGARGVKNPTRKPTESPIVGS